MNKYVILGYLEKKSAWYHNPLNTAAIGAGVGGLGGGLGRYFLDPKASWGDILGTSAAGAVGGGGLGYVLGNIIPRSSRNFSEQELADAKTMHIIDFYDKYGDSFKDDEILKIYSKARGTMPFGIGQLNWETNEPDPEAEKFLTKLQGKYGMSNGERMYKSLYEKLSEDPYYREQQLKWRQMASKEAPSERQYSPSPFSGITNGVMTGGILGGLTGGIGRYLLDPKADIWNILNSSALGALGGGALGHGAKEVKDYLNNE